MTELVRVKGVAKDFVLHNQGGARLPVLARVSFAVKAGECLVLHGPSGAGKSTIANLVEKKLHRMNRHTFLLDGDNVRHGLNKDLGFTEEEDRKSVV